MLDREQSKIKLKYVITSVLTSLRTTTGTTYSDNPHYGRSEMAKSGGKPSDGVRSFPFSRFFEVASRGEKQATTGKADPANSRDPPEFYQDA